MESREALLAAVRSLVRVLDEGARSPTARELLAGNVRREPPHEGLSDAERVEGAVERYVQRAAVYVAALTRKSEREAALYAETGTLPAEIMALGELKSDQTEEALRAYRRRLAEMARRGLYAGPVQLRRIRADGSWETLHLRGD
jgi:hypothetical protein